MINVGSLLEQFGIARKGLEQNENLDINVVIKGLQLNEDNLMNLNIGVVKVAVPKNLVMNMPKTQCQYLSTSQSE